MTLASPAPSVTATGPVIPVWLAPWPSGGEALVLTRDSLRALRALGAAFIDAPATPTITIVAADEVTAASADVQDAARALVRRAVVTTTLNQAPSPVDGARRRVSQVLAATSVLLLAFRPTLDGEYAVQTLAGLWLLGAVPILRGAWRRATAARSRRQVDALRIAFGAEVDRRRPDALPPVSVAVHPPLVTLAERLVGGASVADAARHARALGLVGLANAFEPEPRANGPAALWVPIIRVAAVAVAVDGGPTVDEAPANTPLPAADDHPRVPTTDTEPITVVTRAISVPDPLDRKSTRLNSSHVSESRMPSSA